MRTFEPKSIARSRGQVLYRYRQGQTYDHGNAIAQVVGYANDDALQEPKIDDRQLVEEAMRFVHRWRTVGANAPGTSPASDRAPEFPPDEPLAATHYNVVIPGKVFSRIWPIVMRCASELQDFGSYRGQIHTVLAELYSNALEHGLLRMNSDLKSDADGFEEYYRCRAERLDYGVHAGRRRRRLG